MKYRIEKDTLGKVNVPFNAYYGAQTQRAIENYKISSIRFPFVFIRAQAITKKCAAIANMRCKKLDKNLGNAIIKAANEIISGRHLKHFPLDVYQSGAGVSQNMNMNEVIANRATELIGSRKGQYKLHPNDHVNMSQSTNDIIHTAIHVACTDAMDELLGILDKLKKTLEIKSRQFSAVVKSGRTHLQDAVPLTLGQEFSGYSAVIKKDMETLRKAYYSLLELNVGGTAIGTGINTHPNYVKYVISEINRTTKKEFMPCGNLFEGTAFLNEELELSSALKVLAVDMLKISDDFRLLSSGPATAIGELILPARQPGSSIMPGKINPVMPEMLDMVCFQVIGNDTTIAWACKGELQLNVFMPIVAYNLLNSMEILKNAINAFNEKCVKGININKNKIKEHLEKNSIIATALSPYIGYEKAADVAKRAYAGGKTVRQVVLEMNLLSEKQLDKILDYRKMTSNK